MALTWNQEAIATTVMLCALTIFNTKLKNLKCENAKSMKNTKEHS